MRTIDEFVKHINNGESSFIITEENKTGRKLLCTCATIGNTNTAKQWGKSNYEKSVGVY
jgi:hypothetical protein